MEWTNLIEDIVYNLLEIIPHPDGRMDKEIVIDYVTLTCKIQAPRYAIKQVIDELEEMNCIRRISLDSSYYFKTYTGTMIQEELKKLIFEPN